MSAFRVEAAPRAPNAMDEHVVDRTGLEVILAPHKASVIETIRAPDAIYQAQRDPSRRVYARKYASRLRTLGSQIWPSS